MRPIKLAVVFDQEIRSGGGYQQAINAAILANSLSIDLVEVIFFSMRKDSIAVLSSYEINAKYIYLSIIDKAIMYFRRKIENHYLLSLIKIFAPFNPFEKVLVESEIDLVYFLTPDGRYQDLERLNFIITIWDLSHRIDPEFPEMRWDKKLEIRDKKYRQLLPKATAVLVDSEYSRSKIIHMYSLESDRVFVLPFQASAHIRHQKIDAAYQDIVREIMVKYEINVPYIFYPAQFWAHKNHIYILEAIQSLRACKNYSVAAIFVGGDKGNLEFIKSKIKDLGLEDVIRIPGFVSNEEVLQLYQGAIALVMPTYCGPTNLPPLEAFCLGVPVFYPDKDGLRDQYDNAVLLMDLNDPSSLAEQLYALITDEGMRADQINKGYLWIKSHSELENKLRLEGILKAFSRRRSCWE